MVEARNPKGNAGFAAALFDRNHDRSLRLKKSPLHVTSRRAILSCPSSQQFQMEMMMVHPEIARIDASAPGVTLVNIYEVEPGKQADLARLLSKVTRETIGRQPGFISVSIHSSFDG
jgi:hypothetical protein